MGFHPFLRGAPEYHFNDDFFYYLILAKSFLAHGQFAFYPDVATNGFQPLWMLVIVLLLWVCGTATAWLFGLLTLVQAGLIVTSALQAQALLRERGASLTLATGGGLFLGGFMLAIGREGMEVGLLMPLLVFLTRVLLRLPSDLLGPRQLVSVGFLGSLVLLARLDAAVLLLPWALAQCLTDRLSMRRLFWLVLGAAPLGIYLAANLSIIGFLMPVSGVAKQLKAGYAVEWLPIGTFLFLPQSKAITVAIAYLLVAFPKGSPLPKPPNRREHTLLLAGLSGCWLFYVVLGMRSDWELWFWYMYPVGWGTVLALAVLPPLRLPLLNWSALGVGLVLFGIFAFKGFLHEPREQKDMAVDRKAVDRFVRSHPGRYAMGDRAGIFRYVSPSSVLQLEGLVGDRAMIERIREQQPLRRVLMDYKIDYYVVAGERSKTTWDGRCWQVREPSQAGPKSPVMKGSICAEPLYYDKAGPLWIFAAGKVC